MLPNEGSDIKSVTIRKIALRCGSFRSYLDPGAKGNVLNFSTSLFNQ
jgi:hypothetical protein